MKAHHVRNRTNAFQAIVKLKTDRRWCLTGTPVQNSLDDLFTLTEFLRFHPVENRRNARRWILDPLGAKEDYAIENLRLLMRTMALRRSRDSEMKHIRSHVEVPVALLPTERQQYDVIRAKAWKMIVSAEKMMSAHNLLSYILQMRQICSRGLYKRISKSGPIVAREPPPSNAVCDKCLEALTSGFTNNPSLIKSGEPKYCLECAVDEESRSSLITDSLSLRSGVCQDTSTPTFRTDIGITDVPGGDVDINLNTVTVPRPEQSSKIDSVIYNLVQLEQKRHVDSTPIKR